MENLHERIKILENKIIDLQTQIETLSKNTDYKPTPNYSKVGSLSDKYQINPIDVGLGVGKGIGGNIFWNNAEMLRPKWGTQPAEPIMGFNKHSHSRFSGGALDLNTLEIVEYKNENGNIIDPNGNILNRHCQQFWGDFDLINSIAIEQVLAPSGGGSKNARKIGKLALVFSPKSYDNLIEGTTEQGEWGIKSLEIDVEKCYLIKRDADGNIELDSKGQEKKSPLLYALADVGTIAGRNENLNKTCIEWDESARTWRFYATYAPAPETE